MRGMRQAQGWLCALAAALLLAGSVRGQDLPEAPPEGEDQPADAVPEAPPVPTWLEGWKGGVELGINGTEGNTNRFNFRGGANASRLTETLDTKLSLTYSYAREESRDTQNKAILNGRNDWLLKDSSWRIFGKGALEYDEFQDWDMRITLFGGVGYEFIKTEETLLLGRLGVGARREVGGEDNAWTPEGLIGADFEHQLTERQKVTASIDVYPDLSRAGPYRFEGRAAYEILVDPEVNMTLKLGIVDRYDSTPGAGFRRNDLDYFMVLVWSF